MWRLANKNFLFHVNLLKPQGSISLKGVPSRYLLLYKTSFDILTEICHQWGKWLGPWSLQPDDNFLGPPQWKYDWLQQPEKPASTTHVLYEGITRPRIIGTHQTSTIICLFFSNPGLWCWSGTLQKLEVCAWCPSKCPNSNREAIWLFKR